MQADPSQLLLQWTGFSDANSGVDTCELHVHRLNNPGKVALGHRCIVSASQPYPQGDCARLPYPDEGRARCEIVTPTLQEQVRSVSAVWGARIDRVRASQLNNSGVRYCIPDEDDTSLPWRFNFGSFALGTPCAADYECHHLTTTISRPTGFVPDERVLCTPVSLIAWMQHPDPPLSFCCNPPAGTERVCMAASLINSTIINAAIAAAVAEAAPNGTDADSRLATSLTAASSCAGVAIDVIVRTGDFPLVGANAALSSYSHIGWVLDGELTANVTECAADVKCFADGTCHCEYARQREYFHSVCLSVGPHTLELRDESGFGWLDASIQLRHVYTGANVFVSNMTMESSATCGPTPACPSTEVNPSGTLSSTVSTMAAEGTSCWAAMHQQLVPTCVRARESISLLTTCLLMHVACPDTLMGVHAQVQ